MVSETLYTVVYILYFLMAHKSRAVFFRQSQQTGCTLMSISACQEKSVGNSGLCWGSCTGLAVHTRAIWRLRFRDQISNPTSAVPLKIEAFSGYAG